MPRFRTGAMGCFYLAFFLSLMLSPSSSSSVDEASLLIRFKQTSVDIDPKGYLMNWVVDGSSSNPCSWTGVVCSLASGPVRKLNLSSMGLIGRLAIDDLMVLPNLTDVDLHDNLFHGNLSYKNTRSSSLTCSFETIDLSANNLSGMIPVEFLTSCSSLVSLNLSRNSILGGITILGGVFPFGSSLRELDLSRNGMDDTGLLNYLLSNCISMNLLNLSDNHLAGSLRSPSPCTNITVFDLSYNLISGEIPVEFVSGSTKQLLLSHNNISGDFSTFDFGRCDGFRVLDLASNSLNGVKLPQSLAECRSMEQLDLSGNDLGGEISPSLKNLVNLERLSLKNNRFSGKIPLACGAITELDLSGNQLTGGLPPEFIGCSSLQTLDLGNNQLSGDFIRDVISTIGSLRRLLLAFNNISGSLPLLINCTLLEVIDLSSNEFTGDIPTGFCSSLPSLQKLLLVGNLLTGTVPLEIGECSNLTTIDLSLNYLRGSIPLEVWSLPKLSDLIMWANNLSGEIPASLCSNGAASLETLILSHNVMGGSLPPSIAKCLNLAWVALSGNHLAGGIPPGFGNLQSLAILQLDNNSLSGRIPRELGNCRSLVWLDLNSNRLVGPIPPSLASQTGLITPRIFSGKQFAFLRNEAGNVCRGSGELFEFAGIRTERLMKLPLVQSCPGTRIYTVTKLYSFASNGSIIYLDLSYNKLSGTIPAIGLMNYLEVLNLGHNELAGTIPGSFDGLKMIGVLILSHNRLTGFIPGGLGNLTFLADLDLSNNNLTGPIPASGQFATFPATRYENNSGLCGYPLPACQNSTSNHPDLKSGSRRNGWLSGGSVLIHLAISVLII